MVSMIIGVIGVGVVGSAASHGFQKLGHTVIEHDVKYKTTIEDVIETSICFVCVPTPSRSDGSCNTEIVEEVVAQLADSGYNGIVALKSTVEPGTTTKLQERHPELEICFVPEFLRERCAISDFIDNHDLCVVGTDNKQVFETVKECHGYYPKKFECVKPTEAELVKYFNNIYNATLITFANNFYEVCESLGANYTSVKNAVVQRDHITNSYLDCNKNFRGFGGVCLPKDTKAINNFVKREGLSCSLFETVLKENDRYITTVFDGMRLGEEE